MRWVFLLLLFFFFCAIIDETRWGNLRPVRLHWAYLHSCVMMWMILAALNQPVLHRRFKGLTGATAMRITVSGSFAPRKPKPFMWRQTAFGFSSSQFCYSSHPVRRGGLFDLCEIRFLLQKSSIYCPLHAVFFLSWLPERLVGSFVSLFVGVKNCAVQIIASVRIQCSQICCISILLKTLVRCQLLVLFMYAHFFFQELVSNLSMCIP